MKKLYILSLFLGILISANNPPEAPSRKVGINKEDPKYTIDVNGSMKISQIGKAHKEGKNLAWNPTTGQIVTLSPNIAIKPVFRRLEYNISIDTKNDDFANKISLGIDAEKYFVILTQANLLFKETGKGKADGFSYKNINEGRVYIPALVVEKNSGSTVEAEIRDGLIRYKGGGEINNNSSMLGGVVADYRLIKEKGIYKFYGDYQNVGPIREGYYMWKITLLVIDRNTITVNEKTLNSNN